MRFRQLAVSTVLALALGGPAVTSADGAGAKAAAGCGHAPAVCATLAPYGPDSFVLKVYAPSGSHHRVRHLDREEADGAAPEGHLQVARHGQRSRLPAAHYAVTRCAEPIKAGHFSDLCYSGGGGIPLPVGGDRQRGPHRDAGSAGQEDVTMVAKTTKCPAGVAQRKPAKKKG